MNDDLEDIDDEEVWHLMEEHQGEVDKDLQLKFEKRIFLSCHRLKIKSCTDMTIQNGLR